MKRGNWRSSGTDRHRQHSPSQWRSRHRSAHEEQEYSSESTAGDAGPSTASSSAPELPGFYFDPEKNRYFRLLPGHNNCNPLTKEGLQKKEEERKRSALLAEDDGPRKKAPRTGLNSALLLQKRHLGLLPPSSYSRLIHEVKVSGMHRHQLEVQRSNSTSPNTDNFHLIVADSACERVFTVNDVSHGGCKYGIMNFHGCRKGSLSVEMCDNLYFTNRKVNSVCWASVTHTDSHVLLCLVGISQTPGCVSLLPASLFSNFNPDQPGMLCSFKISTAWSCAWCLNPQADKTFSTGEVMTLCLYVFLQFAVGMKITFYFYLFIFLYLGLSRQVIVTDAVTGRRATYLAGSDVLAQQFAVRAPVLFNGCRSGEIFSIDLRQRDRGRTHGWKTNRFFQESAITSIQLLQDENYLLAADMLGKIKLWDIRVKRSVKQYEGHHNEYAYLPIHVNEPEGLLLAVGQDCYTRLWSLHDSRLLRTIPSPHPAGKDSIPNVVFSSQLGGRRGLPGLLMAVRHDLYYYSYDKDYQDGLTLEGQF
ncbi:DDB1- and CUL4-associated factor 4-like isoform X1 [Carassius gibelio]|uniref:DDB1- and CUL4-associated factor 4-like isoform X1 n=1 Tax=Carassius gibelio TaxID=101364 RepID=UPI0022780C92|nr:DDB1- and CUL4-associated factor 4-like isoform X1 [Carassius gibelio]XP_052432205.1 DDB1- and CUL4-associated factor 4-like isoform X1 [Carassius gibelio]